ncbi:MAG TPA: glycosyl hydrolase, partial [Vicinamibacteria bacterium]|nr:glycosyl hydrolase [Vicinamibacteria bacterium]
QEAFAFPVKRALGYVPSTPLGLPGKAFQGESFFTAPNPPFGAVFTYYLKDDLKTRKQKRQDAEREAEKRGEAIRYPTPDELRAEAREEEPAVVLTVADPEGNVVRRLTGPTKAGLHRVAWDLRLPPSTPTSLKPLPEDNPFVEPPRGPLVVPGAYTVSFAGRVDGVPAPFGSPQRFEVAPLSLASLPAPDRGELLGFQKKTARLQRAVLGAIEAAQEAQDRLKHVKKALLDTPAADPKLEADARAIEGRLDDVLVALRGDEVMRARNEPVPLAIADRVAAIVTGQWTSTSGITGTNREAYRIAAEAFAGELEKLRALVEGDLRGLAEAMESAGAPWTPGRVPAWQEE